MSDFLQSIIDRDPAAKSKLSLILTYPGVKAVFFHRIASFFSTAKFDLIARIISQFSRFLTGIPFFFLHQFNSFFAANPAWSTLTTAFVFKKFQHV